MNGLSERGFVKIKKSWRDSIVDLKKCVNAMNDLSERGFEKKLKSFHCWLKKKIFLNSLSDGFLK